MKFNRIYLLGLLFIPTLSAEALPVSSSELPQTAIAGRVERKESQIFKALNLSPSQVKQMQAIRRNYKNRLNQRHAAFKKAQNELMSLMAANATANQIRAKHDRIQTLQNQIGDLRLESLLEMREVLTPSQRQKLAQIMAKRRSKLSDI
jgi:periplasmic protein CpxP/Spy